MRPYPAPSPQNGLPRLASVPLGTQLSRLVQDYNGLSL
jgi:hypothetical protein